MNALPAELPEEARPGESFIRATRCSKWYGKVTALQDVSLHIGPGVWGLLGPNGSGKSTFMGICAGLLQPSVGAVSICGYAPFANRDAARLIGVCPEADALYDDLSALEFLTEMAQLSGIKRQSSKKRAEEVLEEFQLQDVMKRKMGGYSRGMRQRVKLAQAVVHDPKVLLLDEPLTGTDPTQRHAILASIQRRADEGAVVLFSTHVLPEIEATTDRVMLIARGQLVAHGKMSEIRQLLHEHPHHVRVYTSDPRRLSAHLTMIEGIASMAFAPGGVEVMTYDPAGTYHAIAQCCVEQQIDVEAITSPDATIEALFHYLVERASHGAGVGADAGVGRAQQMAQAGRSVGVQPSSAERAPQHRGYASQLGGGAPPPEGSPSNGESPSNGGSP